MAPSSPSPAVAAANTPPPSRTSTCKKPNSASASASVKNKVKAAHRARKTRAPRRKNAEAHDDDECAVEPGQDALADDEADADMAATRRAGRQPAARAREDGDPEFFGDPIPAEEVRSRWPKRYQRAVVAGIRNGEEVKLKACRHYRAAKVGEMVYNLGDQVQMAEYVGPNYIGRIIELFEGSDNGQYFVCRWSFRPTELVDDNGDITSDTNESSSDGDSEAEASVTTILGTAIAGLKLEQRCEVDFNSLACKSLKSNHPKIEVRNKRADVLLSLLKEWNLLCEKQPMFSDWTI